MSANRNVVWLLFVYCQSIKRVIPAPSRTLASQSGLKISPESRRASCRNSQIRIFRGGSLWFRPVNDSHRLIVSLAQYQVIRLPLRMARTLCPPRDTEAAPPSHLRTQGSPTRV